MIIKACKHLYNATRYSLSGCHYAIKKELALKIELSLFVFLLPLGLYLGSNGIEKALLSVSLTAIIIIELINSAIETSVDRIGTEKHKLSKLAKDLASAAVFIGVIQAILVWICVLFW